MGGPRHRRKPGRVTPKGTRPGERPDGPNRPKSAADYLLRNAGRIASRRVDIDEAEEWASALQIMFRPVGEETEPDLDASDLLAEAGRRGGTAAAVLSAALAVFGPPECRGAARDQTRRLIKNGAWVPAWAEALGDVVPQRAMLLTDVWEDDYLVLVDFVRPDGAVCAVGVHVDLVLEGVAHHFVRGPSAEAIIDEGGSPDGAVVRPVSLTDARAMIDAGMEFRDLSDLPEVSDEDDECYRLDEGLRPLVEQRIGLLPSGGDASRPRPLTKRQMVRTVRRVAARSKSLDRADVERLADRIAVFGEYCNDRDPLRWSPRKTHAFLAEWIPWKTVPDADEHDVIEAVFPHWIEYAAESRGLDAERLALNLSAAQASFADMRANAADPAMRSPVANLFCEMREDGVDLSDADAVEAWLDGFLARARSEGR